MNLHFDNKKVIWIDDIPCIEITGMSDEELAELLEVNVDKLWQCDD